MFMPAPFDKKYVKTGEAARRSTKDLSKKVRAMGGPWGRARLGARPGKALCLSHMFFNIKNN
jgi:hypothetical protein